MRDTSTEVTWTQEQVDGLNDYQQHGFMHPFTCGSGSRGNKAHVRAMMERGDGDYGLLIAKTDGWHCPGCSYRQFWAYDFMFNGRGRSPLDRS